MFYLWALAAGAVGLVFYAMFSKFQDPQKPVDPIVAGAVTLGVGLLAAMLISVVVHP